MSNELEYSWATDPYDVDTNADGFKDGESLTRSPKIYPYNADQVRPRDGDGDGLPDLAELLLGLDPGHWSTDRDRYSDGVEFFGRPLAGTNPNTGNVDLGPYVKADPFVPAFPELSVVLGTPKLTLARTVVDESKKESTKSYSYNVEASLGIKTLVSQAFTNTITVTEKGGAGIAAAADSGVSVESKQEFTTKLEVSLESALTIGSAFAESAAEALTQTVSTDFSASTISAEVRIVNLGNDIVSPNNDIDPFKVRFYFADEPTESIGIAEGLDGNLQTLRRGGPAVHVGRATITLGYDNFMKFVKGTPILARAEDFVQGIDAETLLHVQSKNVLVTIDPSVATNSPPVREYVPVAEGGATFASIIEKVAKVTYNTDGAIASVNGEAVLLDTNKPCQIWWLSVKRIDGQLPTSGTARDLRLFGGDEVTLSLARDTDHDHLPDTFERSIGTNPKLADSDSDGLSDICEIYNVNCPGQTPTEFPPFVAFAGTPRPRSSPTRADTDGDGLRDDVDPNPWVPKQAYPLENFIVVDPNGDKCFLWSGDPWTGGTEIKFNFPCVTHNDVDGLRLHHTSTGRFFQDGHDEFLLMTYDRGDDGCRIFDLVAKTTPISQFNCHFRGFEDMVAGPIQFKSYSGRDQILKMFNTQTCEIWDPPATTSGSWTVQRNFECTWHRHNQYRYFHPHDDASKPYYALIAQDGVNGDMHGRCSLAQLDPIVHWSSVESFCGRQRSGIAVGNILGGPGEEYVIFESGGLDGVEGLCTIMGIDGPDSVHFSKKGSFECPKEGDDAFSAGGMMGTLADLDGDGYDEIIVMRPSTGECIVTKWASPIQQKTIPGCIPHKYSTIEGGYFWGPTLK